MKFRKNISSTYSFHLMDDLLHAALAGLALFILILSVCSAPWGYQNHPYISPPLTENWTVSADGQTGILPLSEVHSEWNSSAIEIEHSLPAVTDQSNCLMFYTIQSEVRVWIDGKPVYEYLQPDSILPGKLYPDSRYHFITLDANDSGKTLRIELLPFISVPSDLISGMRCAADFSLYLAVFTESVWPIVFAILLTCFALWVILQDLVSRNTVYTQKIHLSHLAFLLLDVCVWVVLDSRLHQLIVPNEVFAIYLKDITYFLIPVLLTNFLKQFASLEKDHTFTVLSVIAHLQFICVELSALAGFPASRLEYVMQGTVLLILMYLTIFSFRAMQCHDLPDDIRLLCTSSLCIAAGAIAELIHLLFIRKSHPGLFMLAGVTLFAFVYSLCYQRNQLHSYLNALQDKQNLSTELEHSRAKLMLTQIQPHFLYYALSSIQMIIKIQPDYAYDLIYDFSRHLRCTIRSISSDDLVPFPEELKNIEAFVNIEKMRFQDRLTVHYDIAYDQFAIIPLVIQPLVENAVKHGVFQRGHAGGTVTIRSFLDEGQIMIQIIDTGVGFDPSSLDDEEHSGSAGLKNVAFRLKHIMNGNLKIESVIGQGTTVTVSIPERGCALNT